MAQPRFFNKNLRLKNYETINSKKITRKSSQFAIPRYWESAWCDSLVISTGNLLHMKINVWSDDRSLPTTVVLVTENLERARGSARVKTAETEVSRSKQSE